MRALLKNRAGNEIVLSDVKFDGPLITGTARGQRVILRRTDLVRHKLLNDIPRKGGK